MEYADRLITSDNWITLVIMSCIALYTFAKYLYPNRFQEFIRLPLSNKYFLVHGKVDTIIHPFNIILFVAQLLSVSLVIYFFLLWQIPEKVIVNKWIYVQICTLYSVFVFVKFAIEKIIGNILNLESLINSYLYQKLSYRNILGLLFFFIAVISAYFTPLNGISFTIFFVLILVLNGIALFSSYKTHGKIILTNFFYFILYLCALEISPYIILYKVIT
ncbi:DUF4271 domain-containing protein [Patiriisocius marinistellae]|uniref:DUF4271 domain-containing protein n=1 Tax=Patiriisocius marinistellae TaxID=2494560 RepID=UPI00125D58AB